MNYTVDKNISLPLYMQIYSLIKKDIVDGVYKYGTKLPSKRVVSSEIGVSVIPVEHAYVLLCEEGYAESRERSGYFVIYRSSDFMSSYSDVYQSHVGKINSTHLDTGMSFSILSKMMRKVLLDYGEVLLQKSPNRGCLELRMAISDYLVRSCGIKVKPEQVVIGSGAEYLYSLIAQLLGKDKIFALENPSYEKIWKVYTAFGVKCEMLDLGINGISTDALEETKATVLHVTPFNSFPSGISADASKRREYLRWASLRNGFIVEDNYDSELTVSKKNEDTVFSLSEDGRVIYLNTFTHTVAPSIRVGYMVLPEKLLNRFCDEFGFYSCTVPVFEQYLLTELIESGAFERHINRVRRLKRKQLQNNQEV